MKVLMRPVILGCAVPSGPRNFFGWRVWGGCEPRGGILAEQIPECKASPHCHMALWES